MDEKKTQVKSQETKKGVVIRHKILEAAMRFDFAIPVDMPKENGEAYAKERLQKLCDKLNQIKGVNVEYVLN